MNSDLTLDDNARIAVIGGGPSGSLFSYFALKMAKMVGKKIDINIFEPKEFTKDGPIGCNRCGGVISEHLVQTLAVEGINIPPPSSPGSAGELLRSPSARKVPRPWPGCRNFSLRFLTLYSRPRSSSSWERLPWASTFPKKRAALVSSIFARVAAEGRCRSRKPVGNMVIWIGVE